MLPNHDINHKVEDKLLNDDNDGEDFFHNNAHVRFIISPTENQFIKLEISNDKGEFTARFWSNLEIKFRKRFGIDRTKIILTADRIKNLSKAQRPVSSQVKLKKLAKKFKGPSEDETAQTKLEEQVAEEVRSGLENRATHIRELCSLLDEADTFIDNNNIYINIDKGNKIKFLFDSISVETDLIVIIIGKTLVHEAVSPTELSAISRY